jgi:hypothetical protein
MRMRALVLAALLPLAGCGQVQSIDSDFAGLKGQPIASAEARLGPPESRQGSVSVWTDRVRDDSPVLRDKVIFDNGRATTIQVMERPELPPLKTCTLTVQTDGTGTIVAVDRNGTGAACAPMARKVAG